MKQGTIYCLVLTFSLMGLAACVEKKGGQIPSGPGSSLKETKEETRKVDERLPDIDAEGYRTEVSIRAYDHCKEKACPKKEDIETAEDLRYSLPPKK